jgi:branched-chain amino acid transport system substrate-binding protein
MARSRRRLGALIAVLLCAVAAGCGGSDASPPIRIGVLTDCLPTLDAFRESVVAAVESPLLRRGATPVGSLPSQGLRHARVAGHPVEIVPGCTALSQYIMLVEETRRLVESEHVDVVIGPIGVTEGTVLRRVAAEYPGVTFVLGWSGASGVTFRDPLPNVIRFGPTGAQSIAGLATYAYRRLGWRTAAIVADDYSAGWEYDAAFTAEFCALGGRVTSHDLGSLFAPVPDPAAVRAAQSADGVAVLSVVGTVAPLSQDAFLSAYARGRPDLARHVVLGGPTFGIPANLDWHVDPTGIVVSQDLPVAPNAEGTTLAATLAAAFPELEKTPFGQDVEEWYAEAAGGIVQALEASRGDLGDGQARFRAAISSMPLVSPRGPVRLDAHRQGIVSTYLARVVRRAGGPALEPLRQITGVDQTLVGLLTAVPQRATTPCVRRTPPPWSR